MPYRTKPYVYGGLGQAFRAVEYVIDEASIQERGLISGNVRASIKRDGAGIVRVDDQGNPVGNMRNFLPFGHLRVTNSGDQHVFKNVPNVDAFQAAVRGEHPDVFPPAPVKAWSADLTDVDLADFEIIIPPMTHAMFNVIYTVKTSGTGFPTHEVADSGWVQKGQLISRYSDRGDKANIQRGEKFSGSEGANTTNVVAPVSGKITWGNGLLSDGNNFYWSHKSGEPIGNHHAWEADKAGRPYTPTNPWGNADTFFIKIRPLKSEIIPEHATAIAYADIIKWERVILQDTALVDSLRYVRGSQQLAGDLDAVSNHKTKTLPIASRPYAAPAP